MKKILSVIIVALMSIQLLPAKDVVTADVKKLPEEAATFIRKHFEGLGVSYIKIDKELFSTTYEVVMTNGMEIDFDGKGNCTNVDAKKKEVPGELVPVPVAEYVKRTFGNQFITEISYKRKIIKVELNNDLELIFDNKGNFKGLDD